MSLFTGEIALFQQMALRKGIYPWVDRLFENVLFYWEKWLFYRLKNPVLWGILEDVHFGSLGARFWDFSFETKFGSSCCVDLSRHSGGGRQLMLDGSPSQTLRNLGPSWPEANSPPGSSSRLLMSPPVGFSSHTPYPSIAGEALPWTKRLSPVPRWK